MINDFMGKHGVRCWNILKACVLFVTAVFISSCICRGGQPNVTMQYAIDYTPPPFSEHSRLSAKLGIERFTIAKAFKGYDMIYSPKPFQQDAYNYSHWIADPADMLRDQLLRDFRASNLFEAVFSQCDTENPGYVVQGGVEQILESDRGESSEAVLAVNIILLDRSVQNCPERVMFQKTYQVSEPMAKRSPEDLASGISAAAARLSKEIVADVYKSISEAASERGGTGQGSPASCR